MIDRFGVQAVYGRKLTLPEMVNMMRAEAIEKAYQGKFGSKNWAEWAEKHQELDALLNEAMRIVHEQ